MVKKLPPTNPWRLTVRRIYLASKLSQEDFSKALHIRRSRLLTFTSPTNESGYPPRDIRRAFANINHPHIAPYPIIEQLRDLSDIDVADIYTALGTSTHDLVREIVRCAALVARQETNVWESAEPSMWDSADAFLRRMTNLRLGESLPGTFADRWRVTNFTVMGGRAFPRVTNLGVEFTRRPGELDRHRVANAQMRSFLKQQYPSDDDKRKLSNGWGRKEITEDEHYDQLELKHWLEADNPVQSNGNWQGLISPSHLNSPLIPDVNPRATPHARHLVTSVRTGRDVRDNLRRRVILPESMKAETHFDVKLIAIFGPMALGAPDMGRLVADACGWPGRPLQVIQSENQKQSIRHVPDEERVEIFPDTCKWLRENLPDELSLITMPLPPATNYADKDDIPKDVRNFVSDPCVLPIIVLDSDDGSSLTTFYERQAHRSESVEGGKSNYDKKERAMSIHRSLNSLAQYLFTVQRADGKMPGFVLKRKYPNDWSPKEQIDARYNNPPEVVDASVLGAFQIVHLLQHETLPDRPLKPGQTNGLEKVFLAPGSDLRNHYQAIQQCFERTPKTVKGRDWLDAPRPPLTRAIPLAPV